MNGKSSHLPESWLSRLGGRDASGWLTVFQADPLAAVNELLWDRFYFGPLNLTERGQLLAGWLEALGGDESFASRLDNQLSCWVESNWGKFSRSGVLLASSWSCLASVVEYSAKLPSVCRLVKTAETLRDRFLERTRFLGSFSTAPAADPLGLYLAVIAEFQGDDRSLAGFWHRLCGLPDGVPFYHARYAMLGLRRLKAANGWENGSLRAEVVLGLLRLANAFDCLVLERGLAEGVAKTSFSRVARQIAAAYPDSPRWNEHGLAVVLQMPERPKRWVLENIRFLSAAVRQEQAMENRPHRRPLRSIQPDPTWLVRARELAEALRRGQLNCFSEVERLLDEQRSYAEATGDTYFIVRSLCYFASRILKGRPAIAVRWAEEARGLEPYNPFTWATVKNVLLKQGDVGRALRFAWVAWKRFPEDVVARNGLAEVLRAADRIVEAEVVYREAIDLTSPEVDCHNHIVARTGLAEVLKLAGRLSEAEVVCREIINLISPEIDRHNYIFARNSLAEVLKVAGRLAEAEVIYRETKGRFPESVIARAGLADILRRARRFADAEAVLRQAIADGYVNTSIYVSLAYLLLHQGETGRAEALHMVKEALRLDAWDSYALKLKRELELARGVNIAVIADEWDSVVDELFSGSPLMEVEVEQELDHEESVSNDFAAGTGSVSGLEAAFQTQASKCASSTESMAPTPAGQSKQESGANESKAQIGLYGGLEVAFQTQAPQGASSIESMAPAPAGQSKEESGANEFKAQTGPYGGLEAAFQTQVSQVSGSAERKLPATAPVAARPRSHSSPDPLEIAALLAEASFYRTWAARDCDELAAQRRQKAEQLLARAEKLSPGDAQVSAERLALEYSQSLTANGEQRLIIEIEKHPASAPLLILKARMDREKAIKTERRLSNEALAELLEAPSRLRDLDPSLTPIFHLDRGLAALALRDGAVRIEKVADAFTNFRRTVARRASEEFIDREASRDSRTKKNPRFHEWLQRTMDDRLFTGFREPTGVAIDEVPILENSLAGSPSLFEEIEDAMIGRLAFAGV